MQHTAPTWVWKKTEIAYFVKNNIGNIRSTNEIPNMTESNNVDTGHEDMMKQSGEGQALAQGRRSIHKIRPYNFASQWEQSLHKSHIFDFFFNLIQGVLDAIKAAFLEVPQDEE